MRDEINPSWGFGSQAVGHPGHFLICRACLWAVLVSSPLLTTMNLPAGPAVTEAWVHRYSSPSNSFFNYSQARAAAVDRSGNVVVTGTSVDAATNYDYYTAKYAVADGALLWEQH